MAQSLRRIALVVAVATALSKVAGLVRQQVIAAAFGVGAAYDAYNYAYVLPGFLLILLGGINGPFHSAMVSVLARRPRAEGAHVLAAMNTLVGAGLIGVTVLLLVFADALVRSWKQIIKFRPEGAAPAAESPKSVDVPLPAVLMPSRS